MIGRGFRSYLLPTGVVVCAAAGVAPAQFAHVGVVSPGMPCVTGECAAVNRGGCLSALFARSRHMCYRPVACGPTLIPGAPYGHFETKWRKWEDHAGGCATGVVISQPVVPPMPVPPALKPDVPTPLPKQEDAKPADPVAPPKLPAVPKQVSVDVFPAPLSQVLSATSDKPALEVPNRVVLPPLTELPTKR